MRSASFLAISTALFLAHAAACANSDDLGTDDPDAEASSSSGNTTRDAGRDARVERDSSTPSGDACENERVLYEECGFEEGVTCGLDGYVANCHANETATESAQRIAGRQACLGAENCEPADRKECIYETYNSAQLDPAQDALVTHYCSVCEPDDVAACNQRTRRYTTMAATDSVFLAAWELSPALVKAIDEQCIDSAAADAGDGGTASCYKSFDNCAGGLYIDALVDCAD